ncbi:MAG TPA: hypothetical protein VFV34_11370 [Blastocatellia bacterium]|nr:hypothetical protein [Blastocatellia bacterium]
MSARSRVARRLVTTLLTLTFTGAADAQNLTLSPREIPEGAKNFRITIERADRRPFTTRSNALLSVGIAFGTKLVIFDAKPDRPQSPQSLTVVIKDASTAWSQAPRAGDNLLVAVYLNKSPVTAATQLPVVGRMSQSHLGKAPL